ncbi:hypothetical protein AAF712_013683 [Marasmius tenuissimus]|uniref:Transmembrane protein n=1 Tax=Marasmius tenuissimus TaxID=585030 RepID=A0ABR2ZEC0_9AGAR
MAEPTYFRRVVVDDTDPRITYHTGAWNFDISSFDSFGERGDPYNKTMKGTNSGRAGFTFTFEGDYIQVKGAKDNRRIVREPNSTTDSADLLPKYTCQIDDIPIGTFPYELYMYATTNLVLCEQARLSRKNHTVTIDVTVDNPKTQMFWLDSIEYGPLDTVDLTQETLKVMSGDTRNSIYYNETGNWNVGTAGNQFIWTDFPGATMSFRFNGTFVALYGYIDHPSLPDRHADFDSSTGSYYIDNGSSTSFELARSDHLPSSPNNYTFWSNRHLFNVSLEYTGREHEMVISYSGAHNNPNEPPQWLAIDYFHVRNDRMPPIQGNGSVPGTSSQSDSNRKTPLGPIVGGVVGGIVALLTVAVLVWFFKSKRRREEIVPYMTQVTDTSVRSVVGGKDSLPGQSPPTGDHPSDNSLDVGGSAQPVATSRRHHDREIRYDQNMNGSSQLADAPPTYTPE